MDHKEKMKLITEKARKAAGVLCALSERDKNVLLGAMAQSIRDNSNGIKTANRADMEKARERGLTAAFLDRLELTEKRIKNMALMLDELIGLKDPVGDVLSKTDRPNGLIIEKVRVPIGVIGIIYESRPNVTADCAGLCLKSGNAVILRGGSAASRSNQAIYDALSEAVRDKGYPELFFLLQDTSRKLVEAMLKARGGIDLVMPRGGEALIEMVTEKSLIPVIKHYKGLCHIYVDRAADLEMAESICMNAKVQRPGVCNAMETMLVHKTVAADFIPLIAPKLLKAGVRIKGCDETVRLIGTSAEKATETDYATEWLALVLNVKVVESLEQALEHIARYGSGHSEAIITEDENAARIFKRDVDASSVYVNASTRFTDGGEFGKGAEIGISTDKLHARGPMGLEELTTYKYVITGTGQVRE